MEDITTLISNVGFPIAVCIGLYYYIQTTIKELTTAVSNNTVVLEKLLTKLDKDDLK